MSIINCVCLVFNSIDAYFKSISSNPNIVFILGSRIIKTWERLLFLELFCEILKYMFHLRKKFNNHNILNSHLGLIIFWCIMSSQASPASATSRSPNESPRSNRSSSPSGSPRQYSRSRSRSATPENTSGRSRSGSPRSRGSRTPSSHSEAGNELVQERKGRYIWVSQAC